MNYDALHRYLWRHRGERDRVAIDISQLAQALGIGYTLANLTVIAMREEGRVRPVAWQKQRKRIYQVVDPADWKPRDLSTHARPATEPVWG